MTLSLVHSCGVCYDVGVKNYFRFVFTLILVAMAIFISDDVRIILQCLDWV